MTGFEAIKRSIRMRVSRRSGFFEKKMVIELPVKKETGIV